MDSLRKSLMGNYSVILSLLGCLDHGVSTKKLVDRVIDSCSLGFHFHEVLGIVLTLRICTTGDHVVNLREDIFRHRIRYALTHMDNKRESYLNSAVRALEK